MATRRVKLGDETVDFPSRELQPLNDSTELYRVGDWTGLRGALEEDGYLYVKQLISPAAVYAAGTRVMDHLASLDTVLDPAFPPESGILRERCGIGCLPFLEGRNDLTQSAEISNVIAGSAVSNFMQNLLVRHGLSVARTEHDYGTVCVSLQDAPILTLEYKWLRAMPRATFTGAHCDRVYMSRCEGAMQLRTPCPAFCTTLLPLQR